VASFQAGENARARLELVNEPQARSKEQNEDDRRRHILLHAKAILVDLELAKRIDNGTPPSLGG
jgi:hypothetical protein